jgi:hypothetical protein
MGLARWGTTKPSMMSDIYFCLSLQSMVGDVTKGGHYRAKRDLKNATALKAVWLDIDVGKGKGYETKEAAIDGLSVFLGAANLPPPSAIISSGGGYHVYWFSDRTLTIKEWAPNAEGLKNLALLHNLKCDAGLTTDAARVLRVPGTFNSKTSPPRPVKVVGELGPDYDFDTVFAEARATQAPAGSIPSYGTVTKPIKLFYDPAEFPAKPIPPGGIESLSEGINVHDDRPLQPDAVFANCPHFFEAATTHGAGYEQGLWMLDILGTTFFDDGRTWAHYLSKGYEKYSKEETDAMYDRKTAERKEKGLGWPSCASFEAAGCTLCKTCTKRGSIRSPLNFAERALPPTNILFEVVRPPSDDDLPFGYARNDAGFICKVINRPRKGGNTEPEFAECFLTKVYDFQLHDDGLSFVAELDKGHSTVVKVRMQDWASEQEAARSLLQQHVCITTTNKKYLLEFLMDLKSKLNHEREAIRTKAFGWAFDDGNPDPVGFAYGNINFTKGEKKKTSPMVRTLAVNYTPCGKPEPWYELHHKLTGEKRPAVEIAMCVALASPLIRFTGLNGVLVCMTGNSGGHKSTSFRCASAVWSNPKTTKIPPQSTPKSIVERAGNLRHLPYFIDEVTDPDKMQMVHKTLTTWTEGLGPIRLNRDGSEKAQLDWQLMVMTNSNNSFADHTAKYAKGTAAYYYRLFEFIVGKAADNSEDTEMYVDRLAQSLDMNFGHVGLAWAEWLGNNAPLADSVVQKLYDQFKMRVNAGQKNANDQGERHWLAACACILAAAFLANQYLKCSFNFNLIVDFLTSTYQEMRRRAALRGLREGSEISAENTLTEFLKAHLDRAVTSTTFLKGKGRKAIVNTYGGPPPNTVIKKPIDIRWVLDPPELYFSRTALETWMLSPEIQKPWTMETLGLKANFRMRDAGRLNLANGTRFNGGREEVFAIPLDPSMDLYEEMWKIVPPEDPNRKIMDDQITSYENASAPAPQSDGAAPHEPEADSGSSDDTQSQPPA